MGLSGEMRSEFAAEFDPVNRAVQNIFKTYGDRVSVQKKSKSLTKFGVINNLSTVEQMVWDHGGIEALPSGNDIDTISSSSASDTIEVIIEGHTLDSDGNKVFTIQTATLNGQNKVTLSTPLHRSSRIYNNTGTNLVGDVYVYEDGAITAGVPDTAADVHLKMPIGNEQSLKAATTISYEDYWIIKNLTIGVNRQTARSVAFKIQVAEQNKVFRTRLFMSASSDGGSIPIKLDPCLIVPKNADMRVLAVSTGTGTTAEATLHGDLAIVVG